MDFIIPWVFLLTVAGITGYAFGYVIIPVLWGGVRFIGVGIRILAEEAYSRLRGLERRRPD